jgi:hypothetical protein
MICTCRCRKTAEVESGVAWAGVAARVPQTCRAPAGNLTLHATGGLLTRAPHFPVERDAARDDEHEADLGLQIRKPFSRPRREKVTPGDQR